MLIQSPRDSVYLALIVLFTLFVMLVSPRRASAQVVVPDSYIAGYYNAGAPNPVQTETFLASAVTCNQPPITAPNTVNPTKLTWNDPANTGRICVYTASATGPLLSLPVGNYEGILTAVNAAGSSPGSNRAPFSRLATPTVPTGLVLTR